MKRGHVIYVYSSFVVHKKNLSTYSSPSSNHGHLLTSPTPAPCGLQHIQGNGFCGNCSIPSCLLPTRICGRIEREKNEKRKYKHRFASLCNHNSRVIISLISLPAAPSARWWSTAPTLVNDFSFNNALVIICWHFSLLSFTESLPFISLAVPSLDSFPLALDFTNAFLALAAYLLGNFDELENILLEDC